MLTRFSIYFSLLSIITLVSADERKYSNLAKTISNQVLEIISDKGEPRGKTYNLAVIIASSQKSRISKQAQSALSDFENRVKMILANNPKVVIIETELTSNPAVLKIMENQQLLGAGNLAKLSDKQDEFQIAMPDFFVNILVGPEMEQAQIKVHKVNYSLLGAFNVDLKPVSERAEVNASNAEKINPSNIEASSILAPTVNYTYGPEMVNDDYFNSVWAEGSKGDGLGDNLLFRFDRRRTFQRFEIVNGFSALHKVFGDLYFLNNRVRELKIEFEDGIENFVFRDKVKGYQVAHFARPHTSSWARITIVSVHKGKRWDDTCIAEAHFFGQ